MPSTTAPRTSDRILDAALTQFGRRGYEATSLDDLAAGLGVRKQTILYHFSSKPALLDAVIDRSAAELSAALEAGVRIGPAWGAAVRAAASGARSTRSLVARRGLALRLGERSVGHLDPGAVSCLLLLRALGGR